ncbi:hypothetical protein RvY_07180 [Ramazzottius varieornatus]|uniref:Uncharacterized protein n=1 Tax=Ramazzottius varieornatus TaxID=947166 RepID=A0A1D1V6A1_RAMVA|nr:hypothetical protein RvY_07180 [Ramazzottius varieornatus]
MKCQIVRWKSQDLESTFGTGGRSTYLTALATLCIMMKATRTGKFQGKWQPWQKRLGVEVLDRDDLRGSKNGQQVR